MKRVGFALVAISFASMVTVGACGDDTTNPSGSGPGSGGSGATGNTGGDNTGGGVGASGGGTNSGGSGGAGASGGGTASGGGGAGGTGSGSGGGCPNLLSDPCSTCAHDNCLAQYCECTANSACFALVGCLQPCDPGDTECQQDCLADNADGITDAFLVGACTNTECAGLCPVSQDLTPCTSCLFANCESEMNACIADPDCYAALTCIQACDPGDQVCQFGCIPSDPDSRDRALAVQGCASPTCDSQCF